MRFKDKVVIVTGGASGIGKRLKERFEEEGAHVCVFDILPNDFFQGTLSNQKMMDAFIKKVLSKYDHVNVLINNAPPVMQGIKEGSYEGFNHALLVGISAPFYLSQQLMDHFALGASIINITSTRDAMSMEESESYAAAKGGLMALTHAMAISLARRVRVNAIAPGWIDTKNEEHSAADRLQQPVGRIGTCDDVCELAMFLASDAAGFITGEEIVLDGGMSRLMVYHGEHGWTFQSEEE